MPIAVFGLSNDPEAGEALPLLPEQYSAAQRAERHHLLLDSVGRQWKSLWMKESDK